MVIARGWEKCKWELFNGYKISVLPEEKLMDIVNMVNTTKLYS
jgi:hypothetical protein